MAKKEIDHNLPIKIVILGVLTYLFTIGLLAVAIKFGWVAWLSEIAVTMFRGEVANGS